MAEHHRLDPLTEADMVITPPARIRWVPRLDSRLLIVTDEISQVMGIALDGAPVVVLRLVTLDTEEEAVVVAQHWRGSGPGDIGAVAWPVAGVDDVVRCTSPEALDIVLGRNDLPE